MFVPWYNNSEWKYVYSKLHTVNSLNEEGLLEALRILKLWKMRTSLLSAGVEGTLIILDAMLLDKNKLSNSQIAQIYAISLMRFLNLCAANNDKQGTFNKTVLKNELPKWLISIRHDISHDHKLPSKSILELALKQSLEWLMEKYWNVQNDMITDYVVTENLRITELLNMFVRLKINHFSHQDMNEYDEGFMEKINYKLTKRYNKSKTNVEGILGILEEMLKQSFTQTQSKNVADNVSEILVTEVALLYTVSETASEGNEILPISFRNIWSNLLNIIFEKGLIFSLLMKLLDVTNDVMYSDHIRKLASLWIKEIFQGLLKLQRIKEELDIQDQSSGEFDLKISQGKVKSALEDKYPEYKECLEFEAINHLGTVNSRLFEEKVLDSPNIYTLNYLKCILKYNKNSESCINDKIKLVENMTSVNDNDWKEDELFTVNHLDASLISSLGIDLNSDDMRFITENVTYDNTTNISVWNEIEDKSAFDGCPLGVLPWQERDKNPAIFFVV